MHPGFLKLVLLRGRAREERPRPARKAEHRLLSKGATRQGAAEDTPSLSRQRVGDTGVHGRGTRRGTRATHESFAHLCRPGWVPVASLAGNRRFALSVESARLAANGPPLRRRTFAHAGETKPREGSSHPMRARMMALVVVPVHRIWSAEIGKRQRSREALSQRH